MLRSICDHCGYRSTDDQLYLWFQTRESVVLLVMNYMYLWFQTRESVVLLVMNYMYLWFQTRKSVVLYVYFVEKL